MNGKRRVFSMALATAAAMLCYGGRAEGGAAESALSPAEVMNDPVEIEAFRTDLGKYIEGMKAVADAAGLPSELDVTLQGLPNLTNGDLSILRAAFAKTPSWRTHPRTLGSLLRLKLRGAPLRLGAGGPRITSNDCPAAMSWGYTQTDIEIAADVALAADVVLEAIPQDVLGVAARIVAVALWAIPQGVLRGFEHLYNVAQVCQSDTFESGVNGQLSVIINNETAIMNNDNANTTTILNNANASTTQIINNGNSNTANILASLGANADLAEARQIEDNLARDSCTAWMYTPEYADAARTIKLGGRFEKVVAVIQGVIDDARALQTVKRFELVCAQDSLDDAVAKAGRRPPFRPEKVCDLLLDAYEKVTPSVKDHGHGHSDKDHDHGHRGTKDGAVLSRPAGVSAAR